jgi:hypothetical protein
MTRIPALLPHTLWQAHRHSIRLLAIVAAALVSLSAVCGERAEALSLSNPGTAGMNKAVIGDVAIEVRGGHGGHGGFGGGGAAFHGGTFHGAGAFGGGWHGGNRFAHGRHFRRVFIGGVWYDYPYYADYPYYYDDPAYYATPGCRIIVTDHGPRRVCNQALRRHYHRRHHHHRSHHRVDR